MRNFLYIYFGAPGSGKSTALEYLKKIKDVNIEVMPKETTRPRRDTDTFEVVNVKKISKDKDIRYSQYGVEYGASVSSIWSCFSSDKSAAIIINDIRTIKLLKQKFGALAKTIYIHSNIDKEKMIDLILKRFPNKSEKELNQEMEKRINKITTIHRKYIENTALFDYTILNTKSISHLNTQIVNLVKDKKRNEIESRSHVRIFVIAGAVSSGKKDLVNAMSLMEKSRVVSYKKVTTRPKNIGDKDDLRHISGISKKFNVTYEKQGHKYGISTSEIWELLSKGKIVLLVASDNDTIEKIVDEFGDICTVLYLHANYNIDVIKRDLQKKDLSESEIKKRLSGIDELYKIYVENMKLFDHVLLNTSEPEDLYDQAFNILDNYC